MSEAAIPALAIDAVSALERSFGKSLLAAYLHGSAVAGGLRPNSDVDVLAVIGRPITHAERAQLVAGLMKMSGAPGSGDGSRPLELIVFLRADLTPPSYPARSEFIYGEWLRDAFKAGGVPEPAGDPEMTLILAQARREARTLIGPDPAEMLPVIPQAHIGRAIGDLLPALLASLDGDERNVLLTLARMWRTLSTGEFVPKDVAAEWAAPRLPEEAAGLITCAGREYLGAVSVDWQARRDEVRRVAEDLRQRVLAML
ncbi:aminoglycoside adenylyltransferase family protein [Chelativorans sp.]|uniref:aminoglycoside adenylyltransferase family protein n=1 Tax=Chelativorans sp. TaxID=2203393 RepID=UPI002810BD66|nr:aminoglycoside adenylyltransferase family protein [Chelativorans sp.]